MAAWIVGNVRFLVGLDLRDPDVSPFVQNIDDAAGDCRERAG